MRTLVYTITRRFIFVAVLIGFTAGFAKDFTFVNEGKNVGYKVKNSVLLRLTSSVDIHGERRWFEVSPTFRVPMIVQQINERTYVVKWRSGLVVENIDDGGTEYYMHKQFEVSEDGLSVTESTRFEAFSGDLISPDLEEWSKQPFQQQATYSVLAE